MNMKTAPEDDLTPDEREFAAAAAAPAASPAAAPPPPSAAAPAEAPAAAPAAAAPAAAPAEAPAPAPAAEKKEGDEGGDKALDADALADVAGEGSAEAPAYELPNVDFKAERAKLKTQIADIDKRWADGTLSDEEKEAEHAKVEEQRDALLRQEVRAETIADINRQNQQRTLKETLSALAAASKKANELDYTDAPTAKAFDAMLQAVGADPANEGKSFGELAQAAHDALCAVRGVKRAAAAPTPAPAPPAAAAPTPAPAPAARDIPQNLRSMPAAGAPPVGNDFMTSLSANDDPDAAEAALAAMSAAQKEALMRSTVPGSAGRR